MHTKLCSLVMLTAIVGVAWPQSPTYAITQTYLLGGNGGWDYVVPDPANHRLFIARETRILVIDEDTGKPIGEVDNIHGAHGTALATGTGHGFATSSEDKSVVMFDAKTYKFLKRIPAAEDADAIVFDPVSNRVFSLNGDANSSTVIDARSGSLIKNVPLGGKPEYGVVAEDGKLYANLTDKNEIVEIDTKSATVTRRWPTAPCQLPVSMVIDTAHHRLFSGCRSGVMAISDYDAGKVVATVPIGKGVDGAGYDPDTKDAFASNADGSLTVIHQDSPDKYHVIQSVATPIGSRNMGIDPLTHRIFVVSAKFGPVLADARRGPVLPDSFSLMVIAPSSK
jgi:DNA-binding beta-propeller fold protein YncE